MKRFVLAAAVATAAFAASPAIAAQQFTGTTGGCFAVANPPNCVPTVGSGSGIGGLTYTSSTFSGLTSDITNSVDFGGGNNFGTFSITALPWVYEGEIFNLVFAFSVPGGTSPTILTASLLGSVQNLNNGGATINFVNNVENPLAISSNVGTFYLSVNDVSIFPTSGPQALSGRIVLAAVPETATWAMMLLGFGGIGMAMRRRRQPVLAQVA